ncbi:MAG: ion channel [Solirubrobacteraceae bacterium]|nr:ion channel [Solirubrobacteraceae bacterium]
MIAVIAGTALIALAAVDAVVSTLHPTRRGPVTFHASIAVWRALRALAIVTRAPRVLHLAGPLAVLAVFAGWVLMLWTGFALVYLPYTDQLSYDSSTSYGEGLWAALYVSGMALTTVGYGDIVGNTDALRLVTIAEAAAGFGLITAAITYLLSVYPLLSNLGSAARSLSSQAGDRARAAGMVIHGGASYLQGTNERLIAIDEDTQRFPLLYFFRREGPASTQTMLRGAVELCLQARWGVSERAAPAARLYGEELSRTLDRLVDHYARSFLFKDPGQVFSAPLEEDDARCRFVRLVDAAGDAGARDRLDDHAELRAFAVFAGRMDAFLRDFAAHQLRTQYPLLGEDG